MKISRRSFIKGSLATAAVSGTSLSLSGCVAHETFQHGVASGDPLSDRIILWTRVTPSDVEIAEELFESGNLVKTVNWEISLDKDFSQIVNAGEVTTSADRDYTVKIDADGLTENTTYYYRFIVDGSESPIGKTKTLPSGSVSDVKIGLTSCSHYNFGYFNVYARMAEMEDIDVVLHLGDYLYEYSNESAYRNPLLFGRVHKPAHEIVSLIDYRTRHGQYKTDSDLQKLHSTHPMICIWDDHEFTNDTWKGGAENHDSETEGLWSARATNAIQAYYEWMPIREPVDGIRDKAYRQFQFGDLIDLSMLDTRYIGRDEQSAAEKDDESRTLLGFEQEAWLEDNLLAAQNQGTTWKLLGQQVQMMQIGALGQTVMSDSWDGYAAARNRLLGHIRDNDVKNVVVLTGDIHSSWAAEITENPFDGSQYNAATGEGAVAVEFVTSSVSSPTIPIDGLQNLIPAEVEDIILGANKHIRYVDLRYRGFVTLTVNHEKIRADWFNVPIVSSRNTRIFHGRRFEVKAGESKLYEVSISED